MDYRYFDDDPEADGMMPLEGPAVRRGIPRYMDQFDDPSQDEELDAMLGIDAPELDAFEPEEFDPDPLDSFLERMSAGGVPQGLQKPRGFLQGLVSGVATGAVNRGQRVGERRKKFETNQATRAAERDKNNLQATRDYKKERGTALRDLTKSQREDRRRQEEYARDNPPLSPALLEAAPWLGRTFKPGENVPKDIYQGILKNMTPEAIADIKRKEAGEARDVTRLGMDQRRLGMDGDRLEIARTEAATGGKKVRPSAAERESLIGDIGMLDQIGRTRDLFQSHFVGPAAGRYGGLTQASGIGKRKGESSFRSAVAGIRNQILKLRSGGAVSEGEAARLLEELPTNEDPSESWESKMDQFENTYRSIAGTRRDVLGSTGVDVAGIPELPKSRSRIAKEYEQYVKLRGGGQ